MSKKSENKQNRKRVYLLLGLVLIVAAALLVGTRFVRQHQRAQQEAVVAEEILLTPTETPSAEVTETPEPTETAATPEPSPTPETVEQIADFANIWKINPDAYAYLQIPDTVVSYPILQSSDQPEDYYLDHTFEGASGLPGSIYTRRITAKDFSDAISVVYGHDMLDGSFFGDLEQYADKDYLQAHSRIYVYLPESRLEYEVIEETVFGDDAITALYDCSQDGSMQQFAEDLEAYRDEAVFADSYDLQEGDKWLVLSTCIGPRPNNRRLIIARLLEERPTA